MSKSRNEREWKEINPIHFVTRTGALAVPERSSDKVISLPEVSEEEDEDETDLQYWKNSVEEIKRIWLTNG
jgi:hypothetical protein